MTRSQCHREYYDHPHLEKTNYYLMLQVMYTIKVANQSASFLRSLVSLL